VSIGKCCRFAPVIDRNFISSGRPFIDAARVIGWSSYAEYLKPPGKRPEWLGVDRLLGAKGIPKDRAAGRGEFAGQMERRRSQEQASDDHSIRRGWCLGSEEFRKELLAWAAERVGACHYGAERQATGVQKAKRITAEDACVQPIE